MRTVGNIVHTSHSRQKNINPRQQSSCRRVKDVLLGNWGRVSYVLVVPHEPKAPEDFEAADWAQKLARDVKAVLQRFPDADPDNVRHTLILLQLPPEERLARSLLRGGARAKRK